jgi:hypothetical protein
MSQKGGERASTGCPGKDRSPVESRHSNASPKWGSRREPRERQLFDELAKRYIV